MKIRILALACAALAGQTAHAALFGEVFNPAKFTLVEAADGTTSGLYNGNPVDRVIIVSGASASAKTIGTHIIEDNCDKTTLAVLWNDATGANYRAYACDMKVGNPLTSTNTAGTNGTAGSLVFIKRDTGGSIQGVNPIFAPGRISMMQVGTVTSSFPGAPASTANTCVATGNPASLNVPSHTCGTTVSLFPDAGVSDVEPAIINDPINGGGGITATGTVTTRSIFQQVMGVVANLKLYRALQATQGLPLDDLPQNRPTLSRDFVASALTGKLSSTATGKRGWNLVISSTVDANAATKQVNVCRRAAGSGTQAAANIYFAANPCSSGKVQPIGAQNTFAVTGTVLAVNEGSSTGAVETCEKNADNLGGNQTGTGGVTVFDPAQMGVVAGTVAPNYTQFAYAIGHISRDNDPFANGGDKQYRFVKIDNAQPEAHPSNTGACSFAGCNDAQLGRYDYVFESTMQWNNTTPGNAAKSATLNNLATKGFTPAQILGNNAAVVAGVMALPTSYTGAYESLPSPSDARAYGSRVSRGANSCSPLVLAK